jgi:purine-binding chemotaxis protein CheW
VTAIDLRRRLGLAPAGEARKRMAIGIEYKGESYGLLIDVIGEVLNLPSSGREGNPVNLEPQLARVSAGVHRLEDRLLVVLDIDRVLDLGQQAEAA